LRMLHDCIFGRIRVHSEADLGPSIHYPWAASAVAAASSAFAAAA